MTTADQTKAQTAKSEGKTMTTNKKILKYNELLETSATVELEIRSLQAKKEEIRKEQSELILKRIQNLQHIGTTVFRKYFPDYHAVSSEKGREILGELGWVFDTIQLKEVGFDSITLSKVKWTYRSSGLNGQSGWEEEGTVLIGRSFLHMSDRDFAKSIRAKIKKWKRAQRDREVILRVEELKKAEAEAKRATKKLEELQKARDKRYADAEEKSAAQQARRDRYEASKANAS